MFGDESMSKNKIDSIIPGKSGDIDTPHYIEVWTFPIKLSNKD